MSDRRHIHLDAVGGMAGDMFVAAMLDALPDIRPRVMADLAAVLPSDCGEPRLEAGSSGGLAVLRFALPAHSHGEADHHHGHSHSAPGGYREIRQRIEGASLSPGTAGHALAILRILAEAESAIHQTPIDEVHFHELADWDSVMDVVAAGSIAAALDGARWSVSDLPRGGGLVRTQHGLLPVPAPATVAILQGFRWRDDGVAGERVTPTGGAILAHLVDRRAAGGGGALAAAGTGAGTRTLAGLPNILRALIFATEGEAEQVAVLSFEVDDMTGEEIGTAADRLRAADGVLDLSIGCRMGKKSRPSHDFRLLVKPGALAAVRELCLVETSTIGLRWRFEQRACLERAIERKMVDGVSVGIKRSRRPGGRSTAKAESDDVAVAESLSERRRLKRLAENDGTE